MNPLDWSPGRALLVSVTLVVGAVMVRLVQAVRCAPAGDQCERCQRFIAADEQDRHVRMHAELDAAFNRAGDEHRDRAAGSPSRCAPTPEAADDTSV